MRPTHKYIYIIHVVRPFYTNKAVSALYTVKLLYKQSCKHLSTYMHTNVCSTYIHLYTNKPLNIICIHLNPKKAIKLLFVCLQRQSFKHVYDKYPPPPWSLF